MTQRTLFPTKWLLKLNRKQPITMSADGFFAGIYLFVLFFGFLVCFIGSYATEIGYRIPMKPQLERVDINLESRADTTYVKAIILKQSVEQLGCDMDMAYQKLYTPLKSWGNKSYYNYRYLRVSPPKRYWD